jgi:TonB family protein
LQNGNLAGVFEVFSPKPAAFGERDERTLEALSRRVLSILGATHPLSSVDVTRTAAAEEDSLDSVSTDPYSADDARPQPGMASAGRELNVITWIFGTVILAIAVMLSAIMGQRLLGTKASGRRHPQLATATPAVAAANHDTAAAAKGIATATAEDGSSLSKSVGPALPGTVPPTSAHSPTSNLTSSTHSALPEGSLLVYENGKEVFRMAPGSEKDEGRAKLADAPTTPGEVQPASAVEPAGTYELSPTAAEASLVHRVEPDYPEQARQQQIQGSVVLEVRAGHDGAVQEVKLISGQHELAAAAIAAVKQWRFNPPKVNGEPVEIQTRVTLNFELPR